jgi:hypothetical protein
MVLLSFTPFTTSINKVTHARSMSENSGITLTLNTQGGIAQRDITTGVEWWVISFSWKYNNNIKNQYYLILM